VEQMTMEPYHISPGFFSQRMREVSLEKSAAVFEDLKGVGILKDDNCSHFIQYDDWCACRTTAAMLSRHWREPSHAICFTPQGSVILSMAALVLAASLYVLISVNVSQGTSCDEDRD
jgi:hypothetical protein